MSQSSSGGLPPSAKVSSSSSGQSKPQKSQSKSKDSKLFSWYSIFSPQNIGCLVIIIILIMLAFMVVRSIKYPLSVWQLSDVALTPASTSDVARSAVMPEGNSVSKFVFLGSDNVGRTCYYDHPTGILCRTKDTQALTFTASLPNFDVFYWSDQRAKIAFVVYDEANTHPWIYVLDFEELPRDGMLPLVTENTIGDFPVGFGLRPESQVTWSPYENYIAFIGYNSNGRAALFVSYIPKYELRQLTEGADPIISVQWETETDSQGFITERIVYAVLRNEQQRLYTIRPDGADNKPWRIKP